MLSNNYRSSIFSIGLIFLSSSAIAAPQFSGLSQGDVDQIERDLSANFSFHSVMPPSSFGSILGFEVGLVGGITTSPDINSEVQRTSTSAPSVSYLPHASLVGAVTVPFGLTAEAQYLPKENISDLTIQQYALSLKWTPTDNVLSMVPLNLAVRGFYSRGEISFSQTQTDPSLGAFSTTVDSVSGITGLEALVSPKFLPIIEPYAGLGYLSMASTLTNTNSVNSAVSIFSDGSTSKASNQTSSEVILGFNIRMLLLVFGAEYARAFNVDSYTAKLSLRF